MLENFLNQGSAVYGAYIKEVIKETLFTTLLEINVKWAVPLQK